MSARGKAGPGDKPAKQDSSTRKKLDGQLDEALEESFPASDPASVVQPPHSKKDKDEP